MQFDCTWSVTIDVDDDDPATIFYEAMQMFDEGFGTFRYEEV